MISQDMHVLYGVSVGIMSTVIDAAHAQGVSERSELTPCYNYTKVTFVSACVRVYEQEVTKRLAAATKEGCFKRIAGQN